MEDARGEQLQQTDDRIRPLTRVVAAVIIPFLVAAFLILYFDSTHTGQRFAWEIKSPLTAAFMGAGYLGGAYFFLRVLFERRWHRVAAGYLPVAFYTLVMLASTLLHWDTFDPGHWPFLVWLVIYVVTPVLVPLVWWLNRKRDDGSPEADDLILPATTRQAMKVLGGLVLLAAALMFLSPASVIAAWPWTLTPLTARVMAGWFAFIGVGAITLGAERRWSGWRIPLQSIIIWQLFVLQACFVHRQAFTDGKLLNWFTVMTAVAVFALIMISGLNEGAQRSAAVKALSRRQSEEP